MRSFVHGSVWGTSTNNSGLTAGPSHLQLTTFAAPLRLRRRVPSSCLPLPVLPSCSGVCRP